MNQLTSRAKRYASNPRGALEVLKIRLFLLRFRVTLLPKVLQSVKPGDIVVDCGANVGIYTELFAARGAVVHAFEPHPAAFAELTRKFHNHPRVHLHNAAVAAVPGQMNLYLANSGEDSLSATLASSLIAEKPNVDPKRSIEVEAISLSEFLPQLLPIKVLKMDIEGAEYSVLNDLFDRGLHREIGKIVVETHERVPSLASEHAELLGRIEAESITNVALWWR